MKNHIKVYLEGMKIQKLDRFEDMYIPCEWYCGRPSVDVNHIDARGMGGSKTKDYLENLVGMCRKHHDDFEAGRIDEDELRQVHLNNIP